MFADQFKLKIVDRSTDTSLHFVVYYAEEGSNEWIMIYDCPSRIEANAFIDGIEFRDSNAI